jgi:Flp pilus assembly protein TadD
MKEERYTEAAHEFETVLRFQPDSADAHFNLGNALVELHSDVAARQEYLKALKIHPDDPLALTAVGMAYARVHDDSDALKYLRRAHTLEPSSVRTSSALAAVYIELKMFPDAVSIVSGLSEAGSTEKQDVYSLATLALEEGSPELGVRFVADYPDLLESYYAASCQWAANQIRESSYREALRTLKAVAEASPQTAEYHELLGTVYYKLDESKIAVEELQKAIRLDSSHPEYYSELAMVFLEHRTADGAILVFNAGLKVHSGSPELWMGLGLSYDIQGDTGAAKKALDQAISLDPHYAPAYIVLCDILSWSGQDGELLRIIGQASAAAPNSYLLPYYYGIALEHNGSKRAISQFRKSIALNPKFPWSYYQLGCALADSRDTSGAIHAFEKSLSLDPKVADAHYRLFLIYRNMGKQTLATKNLNAFLEIKQKYGQDEDDTVKRLIFTVGK